jgi:enediyne biosynthesis protein E4
MLKSSVSLKFILFFLPILLICSCNKSENAGIFNSKALFKLLEADQTNIHFQNTLTEGPNTNILMYEYFYNGGGVATADFNGDGQEDIYFTSNMGENILYLNKGKMQFEDITSVSGAGGRPGPWKTGISAVDINSDGLMDLYLCYSGAMPMEKRMNQLFINEGNDANGIPHFTDKAAEYGLNSPAFSNQAYFFDFDKDHDLDMLLLNHNPKSMPILNENETVDLLKKDDQLIGIRLFKNNGKTFEDYTTKSGISSSALSYGLGLGISDFNNDGWPDFYVSNDYQIPDYLYINNKNGTFTDKVKENLGHTSQFSMGNDIADVNNDGHSDIFTLDMLPEDNHRQKLLIAPDNFAKFDLNLRSGFGHQYMRNMLHLNNGNNTYSEIGQVAGISNTDWSWSALLADYNADGYKDLLVTNGYTKDYTNQDFIKYMNDFTNSKGQLMREDVQQIIEKMPASNVSNYIFSNKNGIEFENKSKEWGIDIASNSNGAAYADLDNDGDLDVIINNVNKPAFIYENQSNLSDEFNYLKVETKGLGSNLKGIGAKVKIFLKGKEQTIEQNPFRGYLSTVSTTLNFGIGKNKVIDSLSVEWIGGKRQILTNIKANQVLVLKETDANEILENDKPTIPIFSETKSKISFEHQVNKSNDFARQPLLISQLSHIGPTLKAADLTNDGLEDVIISGSNTQTLKVFIQDNNGNFVDKTPPNFTTLSAATIADLEIFDANIDGFNDIYIAYGGYDELNNNDIGFQDRLYMNDKSGNFVLAVNSLPKMTTAKSTIEKIDINKDGFLDLFIGSSAIPGKYPESADNYILVNNGKGIFTNQIAKLAPELLNIGMVKDAKWVDLNNDKTFELVVVGDLMPIMIFENSNGKLKLNSEKYIDKNYSGFWNCIKTGDFNNDGKQDLVLGNMGTNSQLKTTESEPIEVFYGDYDKNGSIDPLLSTYVQGKSFPYITRDEFFIQFAGFKAKYNTYESFSDATLASIFDKGELDNSKKRTVNYLKTLVLLSTNTVKLKEIVIPIEAQYSSINDILVFDYNNDKKSDILLVGNNKFSKIRLGKQDANYGTLLKGDGNGNFQYINQSSSGFKLKGDIKSIISLNKIIYFGVNEGSILAYTQ